MTIYNALILDMQGQSAPHVMLDRDSDSSEAQMQAVIDWVEGSDDLDSVPEQRLEEPDARHFLHIAGYGLILRELEDRL